jgi:SAM-dependent methyltransferase
MNNRCDASGSNGPVFFFEKNTYNVMKCKSCGFKYVDFEPSDGFTRDFYTEDFFKAGHDKYGYADYLGEKPNIMRWNAKKISFVEQYVKGGFILDVGCAAGFFLEALGPTWDRYGCEASGAMARVARDKIGDRITETVFEEYRPARKFDVITMWDVMEHMVDLAACMRKVSSLLKDDGFLFVGTPDASSPVVRILGKHWYHYIPPTHLHFFSRSNIPVFLRRNGFTMRRLVYFGKYVSLAEILLDLSYILRHQPLRRLSEKLADHRFLNINIPYMAFDDMVVMARKNPFPAI